MNFYPPPRKIPLEEAQDIAVRAFSAMAADDERMERFLALSGLRPDTIREAARDPRFFAACLDYVVSDEPLLLSLAKELNLKPEKFLAAHLTLSPSEFG